VADPVKIIDSVLLIRIPRAYQSGMSDLALYEATRGVWRIGLRREGVRYALAVVQGTVVEVYRIEHWQPALTTPYTTRRLDPQLAAGRWEFVGVVADDQVRSRYRGRSVSAYFTRGGQNPITYVNVP
jgi:hypothetical protein